MCVKWDYKSWSRCVVVFFVLIFFCYFFFVFVLLKRVVWNSSSFLKKKMNILSFFCSPLFLLSFSHFFFFSLTSDPYSLSLSLSLSFFLLLSIELSPPLIPWSLFFFLQKKVRTLTELWRVWLLFTTTVKSKRIMLKRIVRIFSLLWTILFIPLNDLWQSFLLFNIVCFTLNIFRCVGKKEHVNDAACSNGACVHEIIALRSWRNTLPPFVRQWSNFKRVDVRTLSKES